MLSLMTKFEGVPRWENLYSQKQSPGSVLYTYQINKDAERTGNAEAVDCVLL